jgi:hypothetical protein
MVVFIQPYYHIYGSTAAGGAGGEAAGAVIAGITALAGARLQAASASALHSPANSDRSCGCVGIGAWLAGGFRGVKRAYDVVDALC